MIGREEKKSNDLFYVCSLIDYVARKTHNKRKYIVNAIGISRLSHIFELADVYHCENIDKTTDELIDEFRISEGTFDNVAECKYNIPTYWDIGKVYKRLIIKISEEQGRDYIDVLMEVYNSWVSDKIDDYNSSMYYENESYLYHSYIEGMPL